MIGSEAGQPRPPLPPRTFESRQPAPSPREKITPRNFQQAFSQELSHVLHSIPTEPFWDQTHPNPTLIIGTENSVKEGVIRLLLSDLHDGSFRVARVPGEENPRAINALLDANTKARNAYTRALTDPEYTSDPALAQALQEGSVVIVTQDIVNKVYTVNPDGTSEFVALGKPDGATVAKKHETVRQTFGDLAQLSETSDIGYVIDSVTYAHNPKDPENRDGFSNQKAGVILNPDVIKHIATEEGFAEYKAQAEAKGLVLEDIAGGIEIVSLFEMGAIQAIFPDMSSYNPSLELSPKGMLSFARELALGHADKQFIHDYCSLFPRSDEAPESQHDGDLEVQLTKLRILLRRD